MFKRIYESLIKQFVKRTGKQPEGIDLLKLKFQAQEEARQAAKVVEFKPRPDSPFGKPGGFMPTEEEAEGIMSRLSSDVKNLQKQAQELKEMGGKGDTLDFMIDYFGLDPNIKKGKTKAGKINYEEMQKQFPSVELFGDESFDELLEIEKTGVHPRKNKSRLITDDEIKDSSEIDRDKKFKGGRAGFAQGSNKKMIIVDLLNKGADFDLIKTITGASDEEIMEAVDFFKYGGAEVPLPTFDESGKMIDDGLYKGKETRPEAKASGGRIKLKKGGLSHVLGV